jgi:hypothetical protein
VGGAGMSDAEAVLGSVEIICFTVTICALLYLMFKNMDDR